MNENPVDLVSEAASILDFLIEALGALARPALDSGLSQEAAEGLATICLYLNQLCRKAAKEA